MTHVSPNPAELTPSQFSSISQMVRDLCGINLHDGKMALVKARLNKRLRRLGLDNFHQYMDVIQRDAGGQETAAMLDALSTNLTYFFREPRHFEILRDLVLPGVLRRHRQDRTIRIWSAGCSSGEEPYSIALAVREAINDLEEWDVRILATDLSRPMLAMAREGSYASPRLKETPAAWVAKYFTHSGHGAGSRYRVKDALRQWVHFAHLNLVEDWPMKGQFDVIFCRNVMIYFDKTVQAKLIERFWRQLAPGGCLFLGHSESLAGLRHPFRYLRPTVYEKA
jgi:chemotaxis protein methyltransferase CheR